jgi:hypothetical protein
LCGAGQGNQLRVTPFAWESAILVKTNSWQLRVPDTWQDSSTEDLVRLYDPRSDAALVISSYPNSLGPALAARIAEKVQEDKQAGRIVNEIQMSGSITAVYSESAHDVKAYITAPMSTVFLTFTPASELLDTHRKIVRDLLADFTEIAE